VTLNILAVRNEGLKALRIPCEIVNGITSGDRLCFSPTGKAAYDEKHSDQRVL